MQTYSLKFLATWRNFEKHQFYNRRRTIRRWEKWKKCFVSYWTISLSLSLPLSLSLSLSLGEKIANRICLEDILSFENTVNDALFVARTSITNDVTNDVGNDNVETREIQKVSLRFTLTSTRIKKRGGGGGAKGVEKRKKKSKKVENDHFRTSRVLIFTKERTTHAKLSLSSRRYQFLSDKIRITPQNRSQVRGFSSKITSCKFELYPHSCVPPILLYQLPKEKNDQTMNRTFPFYLSESFATRGGLKSTGGPKITRLTLRIRLDRISTNAGEIP